MRRRGSPPTDANPLPSPYGACGFARSTIKDWAQTTGLNPHTSPFGDANDSGSGSRQMRRPKRVLPGGAAARVDP